VLTKRFIDRIISTRFRMHEMNELNAQLTSNVSAVTVVIVLDVRLPDETEI
jgi:hypothetical protein